MGRRWQRAQVHATVLAARLVLRGRREVRVSQTVLRVISHSLIGFSVLTVGLALAGCGTDLAQVGKPDGLTPYQAASFFSPVGYSVAQIEGARFRVTAVGTASTPKTRVEKIALARAADYGAEINQKFFLSGPARLSIRCGKSQRMEKGEKIAIVPKDYSVAEIDVAYAGDATGPDWRPTKESADALKAELVSEAAAPEVQAQAASAVAAECHR